MRRGACAVLCACVLLILLSPAAASGQSLTLVFNPSTVSGTPGETITFNATLTNSTSANVSFDGDSAGILSSAFPPSSIDDTKFFLNFVGGLDGRTKTLAAGQSITADIFDVVIGATVTPGDYLGSFDLEYSQASPVTVASQAFVIRVQQSTGAPLPPVALVFLVGGVAVLRATRRRTALSHSPRN